MAANIWRPAGINNNWGNALNWSTLAVPTASDGNIATFDADVLSGPCTTDASSKVCNGIDFSAYNNTITMTNQITCSGSATLGSGMTIAGAAALIVNTTSTLTSNGKTWPNNLSLTGTSTHTLADNWDVNGLLTLGGGGAAAVINGNTINAGAGFTEGTSGAVTGTTNVILDGTGTVTGNATGTLANNLTINTAGTITFLNGNTLNYRTGTLTYTAGTVVTTGFTLSCALSTTLATNGITWNNVTLNGASTMTLSSNLSLSGLLTLANLGNNLVLTGNQINAAAGVRLGLTTGSISGTAILALTGTGTIDAPSATSGRVYNKTVINAPGGTITFDGTTTTVPFFDMSQMLYTAGQVITDAGTWALGGGNLFGGNIIR